MFSAGLQLIRHCLWQLPYPRFEPLHRLWRHHAPHLPAPSEAVTQELTRFGVRYRALLRVNLQLQFTTQPVRQPRHHSIARTFAFHIDVTVVYVKSELQAALLQLLIEVISSRFDNSGDSGPPCGVPSVTDLTRPASITPAFRNLRISDGKRLSDTRFAIRLISTSWFTRSKNFSRSRSTTQIP